MIFVNTRPIERSQALTLHLQQAGMRVVELPLLCLSALPFNHQLQQQFQRLASVDVIVVVSPTAVEIGLDYLTQAGLSIEELKNKIWVAVGKTTAQILAEHGIEAQVPEIETSEGMLSLNIFNQNQDYKVAFWRGIGGRQFMMQQCLERELEVLNIVLYERTLPVATREKFERFVEEIKNNNQEYWICISSEASWRYWLNLTENYLYLVQAGHYLVLGQRLYQLLQHDRLNMAFGFKITQLNRLDEHTVLQAIKNFQRSL